VWLIVILVEEDIRSSRRQKI